jgi:hypothetical protein
MQRRRIGAPLLLIACVEPDHPHLRRLDPRAAGTAKNRIAETLTKVNDALRERVRVIGSGMHERGSECRLDEVTE